MSLKYGLNIPKQKSAPTRRTVLDEDDEVEDDQPEQADMLVEEISTFDTTAPSRIVPNRPKPKPVINKPRDQPKLEASTIRASKAKVKAAQEIDPSIFDYDSFYDAKSSVEQARKEAARQDAIDRKPKYIHNLLDAAARRKQDQQIAQEKLLQKEREAEGDEFADKEKFVTGAYKQQQEENRRLEEEEKKKLELEEKRKRQLGGGMQGFYRSMMEQTERQHQESLEAAAQMEKSGGVTAHREEKVKSDAELAAEMRAKGVNVHLNEEGQITDKRDLLSAGLNIIPSGRSSDGARGADHLRTSSRPVDSAFRGRNAASQQAQRERQTKMMEEQLEAQAKRAREEEDGERMRVEKAAKSSKTEKDVSDAKARYLARKAAKERGGT